MNRIFCDMDGVIVDFDQFAKINDMKGDEVKKLKGAYLAMYPMEGVARRRGRLPDRRQATQGKLLSIQGNPDKVRGRILAGDSGSL